MPSAAARVDAAPTEVALEGQAEPTATSGGAESPQKAPAPVDEEAAGRRVTVGSYEPGRGLTFTSEDERFKLATRVRAQFLYTLTHGGVERDTSHGLQLRRGRIQFGGNMFGKNNRFKLELGLSPRDMGFSDGTARFTPVLDYYFDFTQLRDLSVRVGQSKIPYSRQRVISSGNLQLVDRTAANAEFNLDRDIGVDVRSKDFLGLDRLRYYAGVYFGDGRDRVGTEDFTMLYLARVEVLPFGSFKDYTEADLERMERPGLSIGAAYAFHDDAAGIRGARSGAPTDGGTSDTHNVTADLVFKYRGLSVQGDFFFREGRRNFGDAEVEQPDGSMAPAPQETMRRGIGWSGTTGYLLPRTTLELAARYGQVLPTRRQSSLTRTDEVGGGASYYFAGHPLKLQLDYFARFADGTVRDPTHDVRLQLQVAF